MNDIKSLYGYLEKLNIEFDRKEFEFQLETHPNAGTLLSISDTLNFLNISNTVYDVDLTFINDLPNYFTALVKTDNGNELIFLSKNESGIVNEISKKYLNESELKAIWLNVALIVNNSLDYNSKANLIYKKYLLILIPTLYFALLVVNHSSFKSLLLAVLAFIGLVLSLAVLKDIIGIESKTINQFCSFSNSNSCSSLSKSKDWKLLNYIEFSDLSLVFFAYQILGILIFLGLEQGWKFLNFQYLTLIMVSPLFLISLYYQKFVAKTWCPLCITIIVVAILELSFLYINIKSPYYIEIPFVVSNGILFLLLFILWKFSIKHLKRVKQLEEEFKEAMITIKTYNIFKSNLLNSEKINFSESFILLGDKKAELELQIVTNPFCGYCKEAHQIVEDILRVNTNVKVKMIFNVNPVLLEGKTRKFYFKILSIYSQNGGFAFLDALNFWFKTKNLTNWLNKYDDVIIDKKIAEEMEKQYKWVYETGYYMTPTIFINNHPFPKAFQRRWLKYYIPDLLEDKEIINIKNNIISDNNEYLPTFNIPN